MDLSHLRALALLVPILLLRKALRLLGLLLWVIANSRGLPVLIVYDATVGIDAAQGHASWHAAAARLSSLLRALSCIAATQTCMCVQHGPAHSGDPWNELADVAVDYFRKPGFQVFPPVPVQRFLGNIEQFSWTWMLFLSSEQGSSLPQSSVVALWFPLLQCFKADYSGAVLFKAGSCPSCSCDY